VVPTEAELARPLGEPLYGTEEPPEDLPVPPGVPAALTVRRRGVPTAALSRVEARRLEDELRRRFLDRPGSGR
jgi:hypothetical protein